MPGPGVGLCDSHHCCHAQTVQDVEQPGGGHQPDARGQHGRNHGGGVTQVCRKIFIFISLNLI